MSNEATPPAVVTPAGATPSVTKDNPSESVTLTKAEFAQLSRDAQRASSAQSESDRLRKIIKDAGLGGGSHFRAPNPVATPTEEEVIARGVAEDEKAARGLMQIAADPQYRDILDKDPTLRDLLIKNPIAVLPILAPEALDADDAIGLVKEALAKRTPAVPAVPTPPANPAPKEAPVPPSGGVNVDNKAVDEAVENAKKDPNTERAIAHMVGAKLKGVKKVI